MIFFEQASDLHPFSLPNSSSTGTEPFELTPDLLIIPVPGHSKGHTVLLYKNKFLFTGDHLACSDRSKQLVAWHDVCWYSWSEQIVKKH